MDEDPGLAREKLLTLYGIEPETADTVLLYAMEKPKFIIDEYTKRFVTKNMISNDLNYDTLQKVFETHLPKDAYIYQKYHTLIIVDQKGIQGSIMKMI